MKKIISQVRKLKKSEVSKLIDKRLGEFKDLGKKSNEDWFSELCFCILTANSKFKTACMIQNELGSKGFICMPQNEVVEAIRRNKHRFHNNKAKFICEARRHKNIKDILTKEEDPRKWLVDNIKGLSWKESSHFLRNVGYQNYAIIDRHVMRLLVENNLLKERLKSLNKKAYFIIEDTLKSIADKVGMTQAELDLYIMYMRTGEIFK
jgi:N-glycosylase/DNA lyase